MTLEFAVDRLYETGWTPSADFDLDRLPDGRFYPSVLAVQREFAAAGLELAIKHHLVFNVYRATWAPLGEGTEPGHSPDTRHGTVVGSCPQEAAVYALAQLRQATAYRRMAA